MELFKSGGVTIIAGLPIPSTSPLFLALVAVHVAAGLTCVAAGATAMLSVKRSGRHPRMGTLYFWGLAAVAVTAMALGVTRLSKDWPLLGLGSLSFAAALAGRAARRRQVKGWPRLHISGMGISYILLLTAFYVDNGPNLPLWRDLPPIAFWTLPGAVGLPIMLWALARHPIVRAGGIRSG